jgi:Flp pilus assembly protein TadG
MLIRTNNLPARRGATAVEFAVVAPVFFLLLLGIVEFGRALMGMELLTEAARIASRQAIIEGTSSAQIRQAATDYLTGVGINGETADVIINDAAANSIEAATVPAYSEMTVVVSVPASSISWLAYGGFLNGTLSGQFTLRRE